MAHIAQVEVQTRCIDPRFADARSSSAGATIRGKKCTHLAHSPGAVAQNATRANAAVDPLDLGRPRSHGNFIRHRPPPPRDFPQQSCCEANAMDVNRPSQPAEQGATDHNAPSRPRQFAELGAAGSVDAERSANRGIEGKLPGQCAGQADGAVGTVEATRPAGSADRGSAGAREATRPEGSADRGTAGRRSTSHPGQCAGQAEATRPDVFFADPEHPKDQPSWQLTVQAESDILRALKLRFSTEEKRKLIHRLPLMLHPDKGGTHEATTWFEEWKQTHLEWFMSHGWFRPGPFAKIEAGLH